jgi:membrane associated rhomboid family serine protease
VFPIGDDSRGRRISPVINVSLIAVNAAVFLYQVSLPLPELEAFVYTYGAVPADLVAALGGPGEEHVPVYATVLTSMFMHGGWAHFLGNMLFLWVFGANIEDAMGHFNYLVFYTLGGVAAVATQVVFNSESLIPMIGASGAISAVMAAYFLLFPGAWIRVLIWFGLPFILMIPAFIMIGLWFVFQFMSGLAALEVTTEATGGVAYWAHIGGFVAGALLVWVFRDPEAVQRQKSVRSSRQRFRRW